MVKGIQNKSTKVGSVNLNNKTVGAKKENPKSSENNFRNNYALPIDEMEMPTKLKIILNQNGVNTLKILASYEPEDLLQFRNLGVKSISIIEKLLSKYKLRLGDFNRLN